MQASGETTQRKARGALVVCSDRGWLWQSAFVLHQALESDPDRHLDYFFASDEDVAGLPLARLFPSEVTLLNFGAGLQDLGYAQQNHIPRAGFLRFLALESLAAGYDQVLYVDGDVFLCWGSWTDLFGLPDRRHAVAAVASRSVWFDRPHWRYGRRYRRALSEPMGDRYLNSGLLLVDGPRYRHERITERTIAFYEANRDLCRQDDQSALNAVLEGGWDELSPSWNWQVSQFNFPTLAGLCPRAVHFTGPIKPWRDAHSLFRAAQEPMLAFLRAHGLVDLEAQILTNNQSGPEITPKLAAFRKDWFDRIEEKAAAFKTYLARRDFLDTAAGLTPFADRASGFGGIDPMLLAASGGAPEGAE